MTEAVAVLREIQNQKRDELYLYSEYDPQVYYPKLLCKDTFASQVRCQLYTAFEEHNKLPSVILVVLGNKDVDNKVLNPECTRRVWTALFNEIKRAVATRKEDLPHKAKREDEPRVMFTNMFPRYQNHNEAVDLTKESFKTKRRRLNSILPQVANNFDFKILSVTGILPENAELFTVATGQLNGKGMREFWLSVCRELKVQDLRVAEKNKSQVIQEYFDNQREEHRLAQERRKAKQGRFSLPRGGPTTYFDRGDGGHNPRQRASSLPNRKIHHKK